MPSGNLILTRSPDSGENEVVVTVDGERLSIVIHAVKGDKVKLCFNGPRKFEIARRETLDRVDAEMNRPAVEAAIAKV